MKQGEEILNQFILDTLSNEDSKNLQIVTKQDISELVKKIEDYGIAHLSIDPDFKYVKDPVDLFIVLDDIDLSQSQIGTIKNLLSQKIIIFTRPKYGIKESNMIKLGFQVELEDSSNKLLCFSYNLKTYNNKRSWNNSEGWANPENFDKYRW